MTPRTRQQFEAMREEKKTLIMDTALEHFAGEGYHKTTITHLAKHAGISKGLMYNYFKSKEELLSAIIDRSISEISEYIDPDRDDFLTGDEFELFLRKCFVIISEKRSFWRLFFQLLLQKEVRDHFVKGNSSLTVRFGNLFHDYFTRKKELMPAGYDPVVEMNMFTCTVKGFAIMTIYFDGMDETYEKTVDRIIELYK